MVVLRNIEFKILVFRMRSLTNRLKNQDVECLGHGNRGMRRSFNTVTDEEIAKMMKITFQQRTESKIKWALKCYDDWRTMRLDANVDCEREILEADLKDTTLLNKTNLEFALCRFICEVKKSREESDYPGCTLYQMVCALQNHLKKKGLNWKLVHGDDFQDFQRVLDRVMQERASMSVGTLRKQAQVISMGNELKLWDLNVLGEDSPDKLRNTVLYFIGVNCALRAGDKHYCLR